MVGQRISNQHAMLRYVLEGGRVMRWQEWMQEREKKNL